jgi:hypothetical protein
MLTTILLVIAAVIAAILIFATTKPNSFRISRSATINAKPETIFPLVNDLHAHRSWSPFDQDPAMKRTYSGPDAGKGAVLAFDGGMACTGSLSITDAVSPSKIMMALVMSKPFKCDNLVEFDFEPKGDATQVTWAMQGANSYMGKLMNVFIDCNKMCERQFDTGLESLKTVAEK